MKKLFILMMLISGEGWAAVNYCVVSVQYAMGCNRSGFGGYGYCCANKENFEEFTKFNSKAK